MLTTYVKVLEIGESSPNVNVYLYFLLAGLLEFDVIERTQDNSRNSELNDDKYCTFLLFPSLVEPVRVLTDCPREVKKKYRCVRRLIGSPSACGQRVA